jgi:hypothetical protein
VRTRAAFGKRSRTDRSSSSPLASSVGQINAKCCTPVQSGSYRGTERDTDYALPSPYSAEAARDRNRAARSAPQRRQRQRPSTAQICKLSGASGCPRPHEPGMFGPSAPMVVFAEAELVRRKCLSEREITFIEWLQCTPPLPYTPTFQRAERRWGRCTAPP